MKRQFLLSIFFVISSLSVVYSQLKLQPLTSDPKRNLKDEASAVSKSSRIESDIRDTVKASVYLQIISGNNPRCPGDNSPVVIKAVAVNGGTNPIFHWRFGSDPILNTTDSIFTITNPANGNNILCSMTSDLPCVYDTLVEMEGGFFISEINSLTPSDSIIVSRGSDPACGQKDSISFKAVPVNGGISPTFQWFITNGTVTSSVSNTSVLNLDSTLNGQIIFCVMTPDITCASKAVDTSNVITRSIVSNLTPLVSLSLLNITNTDCSLKEFNFRAIPVNPGNTPLYSWYINDALAGTTAGTDFSTNLPANGDEIYVELRSSLVCVNPRTETSATLARTDTILRLPFFDDFSTYRRQPDLLRWLKKGGTYVNNNLCVSPPSYNVASFDGLQYNGTPYDTVNITARGNTDNLTSLPIDISDVTKNPSLSLVFYWQPEGLGETPDSSQGDALTLYFKSKNGDWVSVWQAPGTSVQPFEKESVLIGNDTNYRHSGFQFQFQTTGRLSGMYDVWNVDYIYLGKTDTLSFADQSFNVTPKSVLKRYAAMPLSHFKINPPSELQPEDTIYISNIYSQFNSLHVKGDFYRKMPDMYLVNLTSAGSIFVPRNQNNFPFATPIASNPVPDTATAPFELVTTYTLSGDSSSYDGKGIDYRINNTISGVTILDNYFAYDDGTSEYGIGINQKFGQVAYKYYLSKPDTLKEIAMNIIKMGVIAYGQSFNICVWKSLPTNPNSTTAPELLFKKNYYVTYPKIVDGFTVFKLDPYVALTDSFFIGYQQISDDMVTIGWDKNRNSNKNIFYSTTAEWINYSDEPGSMMMRPVFGEYAFLEPVEKEIKAEKELVLYPNPSSGHICTNIKIESADIINLSGEIVWSNPGILDNCFETENIADGFYIVRLKAKGYYYYKKLLMKH